MKQKMMTAGMASASVFMVAAVVILAANLRAPLTMVGPLVPELQRELGLSHAAAGALTTIPLLAFAFLAPVAAAFARRFGIERTLFGSLVVLLAGELIRPLSGEFSLFLGTALIGAAIAVDNVLMPALIKDTFSERVGLMMGVYTVTMNMSAAFASGFAVPLADGWGIGWQGAFRFWALVAALSLVVWLPQAWRQKSSGVPAGSRRSSLWRSALAWQVTLFMGLQSLFFYCIVTWLPELGQSKGLAADTAGWLLFFFQFAQLPMMFVSPMLAERMDNQKVLIGSAVLLMAFGTIAFLAGQGWLLWVGALFAGIGAGMAFSLAMMLFTLRTRRPLEAAQLSAMAQSVGYLLAAAGPPLFGVLYDAARRFTAPLGMLLAVCAAMMAFGLGAARNQYVEED
ncbi:MULTISPECIES: CynX/NimT family MFS transporter [Geobacillus]|uniref:Cyanate transporter n=5 Tax=Geobacillus TaxID=129337 RepID=Q5KXH9_GEOKA|nr:MULTISPECIES: MFS transporter [Geobacillus]AEV19922.1 Major facilitator superfamily MFS_1 [Geobacillus thermoleovorans CCB_US3_UF5]AOL35068.1 transporter [Geobacillus thermoleovorans]AWO75535.1 MFS transporter [Geobacillus thermoleovorans]EQB94850.1 transporter [Geobacillus sp. A8]ESU73221.1 transporter [Geobacillus sp. MAS1]